jgi:hypothetical protein
MLNRARARRWPKQHGHPDFGRLPPLPREPAWQHAHNAAQLAINQNHSLRFPQSFAPSTVQRIVPGTAPLARRRPYGGDKTIAFQPMQDGIERAFLNPKQPAGSLLDVQGDAGFESDRAEQASSALRDSEVIR